MGGGVEEGAPEDQPHEHGQRTITRLLIVTPGVWRGVAPAEPVVDLSGPVLPMAARSDEQASRDNQIDHHEVDVEGPGPGDEAADLDTPAAGMPSNDVDRLKDFAGKVNPQRDPNAKSCIRIGQGVDEQGGIAKIERPSQRDDVTGAWRPCLRRLTRSAVGGRSVGPTSAFPPGIGAQEAFLDLSPSPSELSS